MAVRYSISLPEALGNQLDVFLSKHKKEYTTDSSFFQELCDNYLNPGNKHYLSIAMLYLGYPFLILTILLKVAIDTGDILYHYISMLILGLLLAGLYLFITKNRGKR